MPTATDITGKRYGRLTALAFVGHRLVGRQSKRVWRLRCDCGNEVDLVYSAFSTGTTRSCGCLLRQTITTHGGSSSALYRVWNAMQQRCTNPRDAAWQDYGARGIRVCDRWRDFSSFAADMGTRPPGGTLERKDVDGNYEPANCRWATATEQANNRRNNRIVEHNGQRLTLAQWARQVGITKSCLIYRLNAGWPVADALSWPSDRREQHRD